MGREGRDDDRGREQRAFCFSRRSCNFVASRTVPAECAGCSIGSTDETLRVNGGEPKNMRRGPTIVFGSGYRIQERFTFW